MDKSASAISQANKRMARPKHLRNARNCVSQFCVASAYVGGCVFVKITFAQNKTVATVNFDSPTYSDITHALLGNKKTIIWSL